MPIPHHSADRSDQARCCGFLGASPGGVRSVRETRRVSKGGCPYRKLLDAGVERGRVK